MHEKVLEFLIVGFALEKESRRLAARKWHNKVRNDPVLVERRRAYEKKRTRARNAALGKETRFHHPRGSVTPELRKLLDRELDRKKVAKNPKLYRAIKTRYRRANPEKALAYVNKRYYNDPEFNLMKKLRARFGMSLRQIQKRGTKSTSTLKMLGCTYQEFKNWIGWQFTEGMTWDKCLSGEIHLDHIRPVSSFDITQPEQQKQCFSFFNYQPLWAFDNLSKGDKWTPPRSHLELMEGYSYDI